MVDDSSSVRVTDDKDSSALTSSGRAPDILSEWTLRSWRSVAQTKSKVATLLVVLYVGWFIYLSLKLYYGYGEPPFDLAIFDQGMWLISHLHQPFVTIMGRNLFGDHTSFVLLLFAPFYRLFPEPQGLLVLQTLLLAGPAVPIYLLARKHIRSSVIATSLVATYLLNPLLQRGNLDQFHPEAFQVFFISMAIFAAIERRSSLLVVMVVLSLLVKEDAALLVLPLGVWVAARRDRRLGMSIVAGSVLWAMVANWLFVPWLLGANSIYASRIPFGGVWGLLSTLVHRPEQLWSYLISQGRPFYLWQLGCSVGFAFLFAPEIALIGVLVVTEILISNDPYMHQILYQYSMPLAPVLVFGTTYAIAKQPRGWRRDALAAVALGAASVSCALWGVAPFSSSAATASTGWVSSRSIDALNYLEKELPPKAVVSAWYPVVSHIDHRVQIYVWPTPFYASNWGVTNDTGASLPISSHVQYLLLPLVMNASNYSDVFKQIRGDYRLVHSGGGFGLFKEKPSP